MGLLDLIVETPNWVKVLLWMAVLASDAAIEGFIQISIVKETLGRVINILSGFFGFPIPAFSGAELLLLTIIFELIYLLFAFFYPAVSSASTIGNR